MKAMSSLPPIQSAASGTPSHAPRANAKAQEKAAAPFASQVDADARSHVPPAQAARAALEARPDLAGRPFGAIVSLFARHLELPAAAEPAEPPVGEETGTVDVPAEPEPVTSPPLAGDETEVADEPAADPAPDSTSPDTTAGAVADGTEGGDPLAADGS